MHFRLWEKQILLLGGLKPTWCSLSTPPSGLLWVSTEVTTAGLRSGRVAPRQPSLLPPRERIRVEAGSCFYCIIQSIEMSYRVMGVKRLAYGQMRHPGKEQYSFALKVSLAQGLELESSCGDSFA